MLSLARRSRQLGGSMVEFAVVVPVMVMLVIYADYFTDAFKVKLKTQEAARFAAWEFTSFPLSDYDNKDHDGFYNAALAKIKADVKSKYVDFDSAAPGTGPTSSFIAKHTLLAADDKLVFDYTADVKLASAKTVKQVPGVGGALSGIAGALGDKGLGMVEGAWGFNKKGQVKVTVTAQFENVIIPAAFMDDRFHVPILPNSLKKFEMSDTVALVVDPWTLHDGRDVDTESGNPAASYGLVNGSGAEHAMSKQVNRMVFLGVSNLIPTPMQQAISFLDELTKVTGINLADPTLGVGTKAPIVSLNYSRKPIPANNPSASSYSNSCLSSASPSKYGQVDLLAHGRSIDGGGRCFHTSPFRDAWSYSDSRPASIFKQSGIYYMGCVDKESPDHTKCHKNN